MISETANAASRKAILALADSSRLDHVVRRHGMRLGAGRFVAGETLDQLVPVLRRLDDQGLLTNTTLLGEGIRSPEEAGAVVVAYREILDRVSAEGLRTNVALKLTHLGLTIDEQLAYENVTALVEHAASLGNFVRMDMEESAFVDATLRIYRRLREAGHENTGTVLQSYLYRAEDDLASLLDLRPNLRFVKGAYLESAGRRLSGEGRCRRSVRATRRALATGGRLHRDRDSRRGADRARDRVRGARGHRA